MLNKRDEFELSKIDKMVIKSVSVEDFIHRYSKAHPMLSEVELAKQAGRVWASRPTLIQRIKRHANKFAGNGKGINKKTKHHISEIFVKVRKDRHI